mmetsp:Transcript_6630/g.16172  ORF Transcript_6630/g.16172 Transcript_6630/m.16172 type:complete len:232 (-) Transcript_6630:4253-4948(-)
MPPRFRRNPSRMTAAKERSGILSFPALEPLSSRIFSISFEDPFLRNAPKKFLDIDRSFFLRIFAVSCADCSISAMASTFGISGAQAAFGRFRSLVDVVRMLVLATAGLSITFGSDFSVSRIMGTGSFTGSFTGSLLFFDSTGSVLAASSSRIASSCGVDFGGCGGGGSCCGAYSWSVLDGVFESKGVGAWESSSSSSSSELLSAGGGGAKELSSAAELLKSHLARMVSSYG